MLCRVAARASTPRYASFVEHQLIGFLKDSSEELILCGEQSKHTMLSSHQQA